MRPPIEVTNGLAGLSIWVGRFLLTVPRTPGGLDFRRTSLVRYDAAQESPTWTVFDLDAAMAEHGDAADFWLEGSRWPVEARPTAGDFAEVAERITERIFSRMEAVEGALFFAYMSFPPTVDLRAAVDAGRVVHGLGPANVETWDWLDASGVAVRMFTLTPREDGYTVSATWPDGPPDWSAERPINDAGV